MQKKKILVVGGAGYIGSYVNKLLNTRGYETVVMDNLSVGDKRAVTCGEFVEGDIGNVQDLEKIFSAHKFDAVMHFAAFLDVGESVKKPDKYYRNNVANTLTLLDAMQRHGVNVFIFSSSSAIFGLPQEQLVTEQHPTQPISPYGESKLMVEKILRDLHHAYGLQYSCLRYFNAAGGDPDGEVKYYKKSESNLIPVALKSLLFQRPVTIFGTDYATPDGTGIRDYIHIHDLATVHVAAMEQLFDGKEFSQYNLGNGNGFSVREVLNTVEKVTGQKLNIIEGPRREGDAPLLVASSKRAKEELGWNPQYPQLEVIVRDAWRSMEDFACRK